MSASFSPPVDSLLLIGPTGSGKTPLGDLLARRGFLGRTAHHFDFGAALRSAVSDQSSYTADERSFVRGVLERGQLLENEHFVLARKIVAGALDRCGFSPGDLLVLNGIPRHAGQARDIASLAFVHALVVLDCGADAVSCRLRENVGGDRKDRHDDGPVLVRKKLEVFHERTRPLIDHYEHGGCKVYRLSVHDRSTADDAYAELSRLAAGDPPVAFVAEPPER